MKIMLAAVFLLWTGAAHGFSTNNIAISRVFDKDQAAGGEGIAVTVRFTNHEASTLRGYYFVDHIPQSLVVLPVSVTIDGSGVSDYAFESGPAGSVYPGCVPYRLILETPTGFSENNGLSPGSTVEIIYSIHSAQSGTFHLDEFHWAGYYPGGSRSGFGYSEDADKKTITFAATPTSADLTVSQSDSPDPVAVGAPLTYALVITNSGPAAATGVTLTDTLPAGVAFVSATPTQGSCTPASGIVTCSLGTINSSGTANVSIVVTPSAGGTITNRAAVTASETDPNGGNNISTAQTTVGQPSTGGSGGSGGGGCTIVGSPHSLTPGTGPYVLAILAGLRFAILRRRSPIRKKRPKPPSG